jgi:dTDP-4-dehydrorhamnose 3,5-epimerase-like enzyme
MYITIKKIKPAFEDKRGVIANILEEPVSHIAIISSKKGSIRANHYHPEQIQYIYLISGKYEDISKDLRKGYAPVQKNVIVAGDLVITPPMVAHAMRFLKDSVMLNITTGHRDSDKFLEHTKPYKLIE